jgi:hypothetical protein
MIRILKETMNRVLKGIFSRILTRILTHIKTHILVRLLTQILVQVLVRIMTRVLARILIRIVARVLARVSIPVLVLVIALAWTAAQPHASRRTHNARRRKRRAYSVMRQASSASAFQVLHFTTELALGFPDAQLPPSAANDPTVESGRARELWSGDQAASLQARNAGSVPFRPKN